MPKIRIRARISIRASTGGYLTDSDARRAWHAARGLPLGAPIDLHISGHITGVAPWALHPLGDLLADASEVTITTDHGPTAVLGAALTRAAESAIAAEHEFRAAHAVRAGGAE
jgi:hypothetical protein